jgi:hypothetical protein
MQQVHVFKAYYSCGCTREHLDKRLIEEGCGCMTNRRLPEFPLTRVVEFDAQRDVITSLHKIWYPECEGC